MLASAPRPAPADPLRLDPPERVAPVQERGRAPWQGPIGSLVLHLLPLLLLIEWPMAAPPEITPIAVQLVVEPPPPEPPPQPVPPKPEFKPPPPGRIASEDLGDTAAKEASQGGGRRTGCQGGSGAAPTAENRAAAERGAATDRGDRAATTRKNPSRPSRSQSRTRPCSRPKRTEEPTHLAPHRAKFPGPAASRDEYLAYVHSLIRQHYNLLPLAMVGGRRGETMVEFFVLDDGTIATIKVMRSSGWPDIDERVEQMVAAVRRVPPLPQWFQGPSMGLVLSLPFPDALRE